MAGRDPQPIPLIDLEAQHKRLRPELLAALEEVLESRAYIQGPYAEAFEAAFAAAHGIEHAAGCASGTAALSLALEAAGIGPGDEVITVAYTFIATLEAIAGVGAVPVLVDIDPRTYAMDPAAAKAAVTERTKAILPVHVYGTPCNMAALSALAERHGLAVIEDCAQAHLATFGGRPVGSFGAAGTFSFYPSKNLGAAGDAGLVASADPALMERVRLLRDHGSASKNLHGTIGYNHRMDAFQAAILSVKLPHLAAWTAHRRRAAAHYDGRLASAGFKVIESAADGPSVYHLYVVQVSNRDDATRALAAANIGFGVHYPVPAHLQPAFAHLGYRQGSLPHSEAAAARVISLPLCGEISEASIDRVSDVFTAAALP